MEKTEIGSQGSAKKKVPEHIIGKDVSINALAKYIVEKDLRRILVLMGAGVSVAAGIPDFRSPKTGIYDNLQKYNLESPTDAFSIDLLREHPNIFYAIAKDMDLWPGRYSATPVHFFIRLLEQQGRLLRVCTQNIDGLEADAQVSAEKIVEAHGNFRSASCIECHASYDVHKNKAEAMEGIVSHCTECGGIVKPNVVFFGEQLPERFFMVVENDVEAADLVLIIGTSLNVQPFARLPLYLGPNVVRVLINAERVGGPMFQFPPEQEEEVRPRSASFSASVEAEDGGPQSSESKGSQRSISSFSSSSDGFLGDVVGDHKVEFYRDLFYKGDCQTMIRRLAEGMSLGNELEALINQSHVPIAGAGTPAPSAIT